MFSSRICGMLGVARAAVIRLGAISGNCLLAMQLLNYYFRFEFVFLLPLLRVQIFLVLGRRLLSLQWWTASPFYWNFLIDSRNCFSCSIFCSFHLILRVPASKDEVAHQQFSLRRAIPMVCDQTHFQKPVVPIFSFELCFFMLSGFISIWSNPDAIVFSLIFL